MSRLHSLGLAAIVGTAVLSGACGSKGFGHVPGQQRLEIKFVGNSNPGARFNELPLPVDKTLPFSIVIRALLPDGSQDTTFTRYVRVSAKPGAIAPLSGQTTDGRNVLLQNGESVPIDINLGNAFGTTFIIADDLGYVPTDPLRDPPPSCSNGKDDDGDGLVDYPADPGCAFANDDSEEGGTYARGQSPPIFIKLPRIADARGLRCDPTNGCSGNGATPYPKEQLNIDTGYHQRENGAFGFDFDVVVTRLAPDGFYATDVSDGFRNGPNLKASGFNSVFVYTFNAPPSLRVCDRVTSLGGTASEFFGFTQISFPTWTLDQWDPSQRKCLVPEPRVLSGSEVLDAPFLLTMSGSLVRVEGVVGERSVKVTPKFGPGDAVDKNGIYAAGPDATNCDLNQDGKIDFTPGNKENDCNAACAKDAECTEYSNFKARGTFRLTVSTPGSPPGAIQADSSQAADFDPVSMKGKEMRAFGGTLSYFSGGSQFTIEARCADDIVTDVTKTPLPSDKACVFPRSPEELNPQ